MKKTMEKLIKIEVWITVILFILRCIPSMKEVLGLWNCGDFGKLGYTLFGYIGEATALGVILIKAFDLWIWKWKWISKLHGVPVLANAYDGVLKSSYNERKKYKGRLTVKQTFTKISLKYKSDESSSFSIIADIIDDHDVNQLIYTYQNDPKANIQERSPIHHGTAILNIDNIDKIEGNYFTERGTVGYMVFTVCPQKT